MYWRNSNGLWGCSKASEVGWIVSKFREFGIRGDLEYVYFLGVLVFSGFGFFFGLWEIWRVLKRGEI